MGNIVYKTSTIKPGDEIFLGVFLGELTKVVPSGEVVAQALAPKGPHEGDAGRAACYKLTDNGMYIYNNGTVGPPAGFKEWPTDGSELNFSRYPIER